MCRMGSADWVGLPVLGSAQPFSWGTRELSTFLAGGIGLAPSILESHWGQNYGFMGFLIFNM